MGRKGERGLGVSPVETDPGRSQGVQPGGEGLGIAVTAQPVGPRRIHRDEQDVDSGFGFTAALNGRKGGGPSAEEKNGGAGGLEY